MYEKLGKRVESSGQSFHQETVPSIHSKDNSGRVASSLHAGNNNNMNVNCTYWNLNAGNMDVLMTGT